MGTLSAFNIFCTLATGNEDRPGTRSTIVFGLDGFVF
jgi:hypothetical protein